MKVTFLAPLFYLVYPAISSTDFTYTPRIVDADVQEMILRGKGDPNMNKNKPVKVQSGSRPPRSVSPEILPKMDMQLHRILRAT
ncbi:hypothetical protein FKW77_009280 [Venturia effusa]|uniref:Uncharacterized protein n=1 Tax=Venturia effusa TaxID=50376 RepID=A0A517L9X5_9PEZI|nr:hypothetical protein FKW77_009280 [Venturia effusa]